MSMLCSSSAIVIAFLLVMSAIGVESSQKDRDTLCGARCVKFICEYSGVQSPSIPMLIDELLPNGDRTAATINALQGALARRGVHWSIIQSDADSLIRLPGPTILHTAEEGGHFVVFLRGNRSNVEIWDGVAGVTIEERKSFEQKLSGYAIAPSHVLDSVRQRSNRVVLWNVTVLTLAALGLFVILKKPAARFLAGLFTPLEIKGTADAD